MISTGQLHTCNISSTETRDAKKKKALINRCRTRIERTLVSTCEKLGEDMLTYQEVYLMKKCYSIIWPWDWAWAYHTQMPLHVCFVWQLCNRPTHWSQTQLACTSSYSGFQQPQIPFLRYSQTRLLVKNLWQHMLDLLTHKPPFLSTLWLEKRLPIHFKSVSWLQLCNMAAHFTFLIEL